MTGRLVDASADPGVATAHLLLGPATGRPGLLNGAATTDVWAVPPRPAGTAGPVSLLAGAVRREAALLRRRCSSPGPDGVRWLRLRPPGLRPGPRSQLRARLSGGLVVGGAAGSTPTALDAIVRSAGLDPRRIRVRAGSGGAVLLFGDILGAGAVVRVGPCGTAADPSPGHAAVTALTAAGVPFVPAPLASGQAGALRWAAEARLAGSRRAQLDEALLEDLARFCAGLAAPARALASPASGGPDWASDIGRLLPDAGDVLARLQAQALDGVAGLPAVATHADLWAGNLLVSRGRLAGVVDWDGYGASGIAGTDLLHAFATDLRQRARCSMGTVFLGEPWSATEFSASSYWARIGVRPDHGALRGLGTAWWLMQLAAGLRRSPQLAGDPRWVEQNISRVLRRAW